MNREKIKLLVMGCPKSGKSSLIHRYNANEQEPNTIDSDVVIKTMTFNDVDISVHIWELQDNQTDNNSFFEDTDGLVLVSDVTSIESVVGLNDLYNNAKRHLNIVDNTYPVVVVANKIDLSDSDTKVTISGLRRWATSLWPDVPSNLFYIESSAKENIKVKEVFDHVIHYIYHTSKNQPVTPSKFSPNNMLSSIYGNPLNVRRGSAIKTTDTVYSPGNDLSHLQHQRQQNQAAVVAQPPPPPVVTEDQQNYDDNCTVNIVIAGSCYSGKTSVLARFMDDSNIFVPADGNRANKKAVYRYEPTIGVDFRTYHDMVVDDMSLKLQIWDSSGNPTMRNVARAIYRDSDGLILVYDITSEESFNALDSYLKDYLATRDDQEDYVAVLVGNKCDLPDKRAVTMERVLEWCAAKRPSKPLTYIECSALTGTGIKDIFVLASDEVCDYLFEDSDEYTDTDYDDPNEEESVSDEETTTNYTDITVNDEDFTPVYNQKPSQTGFQDNFDTASEITGMSEDITKRKKRPRSKNRNSGRIMSGDFSGVINSKAEPLVMPKVEVPTITHQTSKVEGVNPLSRVASPPSVPTPVETVVKPKEEIVKAESIDSTTSASAAEAKPKKKIKKTASELNDEEIIREVARTTTTNISTEKSCWVGFLDSIACIMLPPNSVSITVNVQRNA